MKTLRVCLAGAVMFLLCAGCFGNCISDFTDSLTCVRLGSGTCSSSSTYSGYIVEVAPEPEPTDLADAGVADAEVWPLYVDAPLP